MKIKTLLLALMLAFAPVLYAADGVLFTTPKQTPLGSGAVIAGAQVFFYTAGTTTKQNTYTTAALSVAHSNPVIADADGKLAPIFLKPSLGDYKIVITTSSDSDTPIAPIDTVDNYPVTKSASLIVVNDSGGFLTATDVEAALAEIFETPSATTRRVLELATQSEVDAGTDAVRALTPSTLDGILTGENGTFVATWVGFTTSPTTTWNYNKVGKQVTIHANAAFTATSNSALFESGATDVPVLLRPSESEVKGIYIIEDNGVTQLGVIRINSAGKVFFRSDVVGAVFTTSGNKGHTGDLCFTYLLD